ncbi:MAG: hypothetical protein AB8I08_04745 [Sandaracinaceae bacterium]
MNKLIALAALSVSLLPVGLASAQDAHVDVPAPDVNYVFDDHELDGTYQRPNGTRIDLRTRGARQSLIRTRAHFVPELTLSIERL